MVLGWDCWVKQLTKSKHSDNALKSNPSKSYQTKPRLDCVCDDELNDLKCLRLTKKIIKLNHNVHCQG